MSTVRYFVIRNHEGVDCLRVEQDDPIAMITCVTTIPLYDIESAITQYRADLYRQILRKVRIWNEPQDMPVGIAVHIQDVDTGKAIDDVARIVITLDPRTLNMAELTLFDLKATGTEHLKTAFEVVANPEIDLTCIAKESRLERN